MLTSYHALLYRATVNMILFLVVDLHLLPITWYPQDQHLTCFVFNIQMAATVVSNPPASSVIHQSDGAIPAEGGAGTPTSGAKSWIESQVAHGTLIPVELSEGGNVQTTLISIESGDNPGELTPMEYQSASLKRGWQCSMPNTPLSHSAESSPSWKKHCILDEQPKSLMASPTPMVSLLSLSCSLRMDKLDKLQLVSVKSVGDKLLPVKASFKVDTKPEVILLEKSIMMSSLKHQIDGLSTQFSTANSLLEGLKQLQTRFGDRISQMDQLIKETKTGLKPMVEELQKEVRDTVKLELTRLDEAVKANKQNISDLTPHLLCLER